VNEEIRQALRLPQTIDITTTGRRSGAPRRIELVFHNVGNRIYLSGMPGRERHWLRNMRNDPHITFHLKGRVRADLPATIRELTEPAERRAVMEHVAANWGRTDVDRMMEHSPLVEVRFDHEAAA
jgi:deazaflavin-dependent oxidoreductase (nitroreductase family)